MSRMPDVEEAGHYSPNETLHYEPHPPPSPSNGAPKTFVAEVQRYWSTSLDRDFLSSAASRRDLWKFILPLPGLLAMIADAHSTELLLLDGALSGSLFLMAFLPTWTLMSDLVFCLIYAAYLPVHSVMSLGPANLSAASPVMAALTLAAGGVNAGILLSFVAVSALAAPFVSFTWTHEQIVACAYVWLIAFMLERRSVLLLLRGCGDWSEQADYSSYSVLPSLPRDVSTDAYSRVPGGIFDSRHPSIVTEDEGSDGEDPSIPLPDDSSITGAFLGALFSRLRTDSPQAVGRSRRLAKSGETGSEAFHGSDFEHSEPASDQSLLGSYTSLSLSAAAPSLLSSADLTASGSYLRGVKLGGFKKEEMNVLFVEKNDPRLLVNDRETYWPASGRYFIYKSASTDTWGVGKATRFNAIKAGKSNGRAHSPKGYELWLDVNEIRHSGNSSKSWREFDVETNTWKRRAGAGVRSRGKVRPKFGPQCLEAEVQTILGDIRIEVIQRDTKTDAAEAS
eukprot:TRINITY_DN2899_c0_g1_i1.p1 TRINITY_DN2899_c0_g1~~TRINITY_DN2899_c0_g1_i1.p1  ORF type:complete len:508 (+),score=62.50 TRINITY_DN2899_c0_g1_i1:90-1613(+)